MILPRDSPPSEPPFDLRIIRGADEGSVDDRAFILRLFGAGEPSESAACLREFVGDGLRVFMSES